MPDEERVAWQKGWLIREKEEAEERKKRQEDDEENKYDLATFMAENKRWRSKLGGKYGNYRRPVGGRLSDKHAVSGFKRTGTRADAGDEKTPLKKKNTTTSFKRSGTGLNGADIDFVKSRKSSLLMGNPNTDGSYSKRNMKANGTVEQSGLLRAVNIIAGVGAPSGKGHSGQKIARRGTVLING